MASETDKYPDGTLDCPIVGTFSSWGFYVFLYLVDLDDTTSGYVLTLVEEKKLEKGSEAPNKLADNSTPSWCTPEAEDRFQAPPLQKVDTSEVSDEAARIINEAMAKLAVLSRDELPLVNKSMRHMAGNLLMMPASSKQLSTVRIDFQSQNVDDLQICVHNRRAMYYGFQISSYCTDS